MSGRDDFKVLADELTQRFIAAGFVVHRYDAYSTSSVYLKLDWGACCSIRIGDHPGYKHLKYRYNIGSWIKAGKHEGGKYPRHYYQTKNAEKMIDRILADRDARIEFYGQDGYLGLMEIGRREVSMARSGFFAHCRLAGGAA
jgi:hypothetical protein